MVVGEPVVEGGKAVDPPEVEMLELATDEEGRGATVVAIPPACVVGVNRLPALVVVSMEVVVVLDVSTRVVVTPVIAGVPIGPVVGGARVGGGVTYTITVCGGPEAPGTVTMIT